MSVVKEIAEALSLIRNLIDDTRSVIKAINDGKEYLVRKYPDVEGLAEVTGVVQNFRFTTSSQAATERSLERFNKQMTKHSKKVINLRGKIRKLKADCEKIGKIKNQLESQSESKSWSRMFQLVGMRAGRKRDDLTLTIGHFYADDLRMIAVVEDLLKLAERSLKDVNKSLGQPGQQSAQNVPLAAEMLGVTEGCLRNLTRNCSGWRTKWPSLQKPLSEIEIKA